MYRKLRLELSNVNALKIYGNDELPKPSFNLDDFRKNIDSYRDRSGVLSANKIMAKWFPISEYDVFISHSHRDIEIVKNLYNFLREVGVRPFVDSMAWGWIGNLEKALSLEANFDSATDQIYLHEMLSSALEDMINQCEVFLFLDTTQSVDLADNSTSSAWIHRELHYTRYLKMKKPQRTMHEFAPTKTRSSSVSIGYAVAPELANLSMINEKILYEWQERIQVYDFIYKEKFHPLDVLYQIMKEYERWG